MPRNSIAGFSLFEVMIASVLAVSCLTVLLTIYMASEHSLQRQLALRDEIINAELATHIFTQDLHLAGYIGCAKLTPYFPFYSHLSGGSLPLVGSDHDFTVMHASNEAAQLLSEAADAYSINITSTMNIAAGDIVLIADCEKAELITVESIKKSHQSEVIQFSSPLKYTFDDNAEVYKWQQNHYYIAVSMSKDSNALYKKEAHGQSDEIVDGIDDMQITYSVMKQGQLVQAQASEIMDWQSVRGVAITLNMHSNNIHKNWQLYASLPH